MYRRKIVIRDIHRYGDDLTVPEAIARLCGGDPVTVTVTDPAAPPGGDPRQRLRHHPQPRRGSSQPGQPPHIAWPATASADPAGAALFAEALTLAGQLAARAPSLARRRQAAPAGLTPHSAPSPAPRRRTAAT